MDALCYEDYRDVYGGKLTAQQFAVYGAQARGLCDRLTLGRARQHPELGGRLALASFEIADLLAREATARQRGAAGLRAAATDGYSEQYLDPGVAGAAAMQAARRALENALGADPCGLLYAGVGCDVV